VRIAHLSYVDTFDIIIAISSVEIALKKFDSQFQLGKGLATSEEVLLEAYLEKTSDISGHHYLELTNESSCV
jgi:hypothetical protein